MTDYNAAYYEGNGQSGDRVALRWYARLVDRHAAPGRALDFGCGPGWMVRRMSMTRGCDGVEVSAYSRQACRALNPQSNVYASTTEIDSGAYAAVSAIHVLEHIPDQEIPSTIAELSRILAPKGVLLIVTPDSSGRASSLRGADWRALSDPTHINLQGHAYWRDALVAGGFELLEEGSDGLWDPPYTNWFVDRFRLPRIAMDVIGGRLSIDVGKGESYLAVARKARGSSGATPDHLN